MGYQFVVKLLIHCEELVAMDEDWVAPVSFFAAETSTVVGIEDTKESSTVAVTGVVLFFADILLMLSLPVSFFCFSNMVELLIGSTSRFKVSRADFFTADLGEDWGVLLEIPAWSLNVRLLVEPLWLTPAIRAFSDVQPKKCNTK